jgi:cyclin E
MQKHITPTMRAILLDWMMEVSSEFTLKRETYHLAVSYVDRFLERHKNVQKNEFQLVGLACLFLASKIEEIYPPKIADFA